MEKNSILLVEDDKDLLSLYNEYLTLNDYQIKAFDNPNQAMKYVEDNLSNISIVITDYKMPYFTGIELIKKINNLQSDNKIKFILISAFLKDNLAYLDNNITSINYNDDSVSEISLRIHKVLEKPISLEDLNQAVYNLSKADF